MKPFYANFRKKLRCPRRGLLLGALGLQLLLAGRGFALDPAKDLLAYNCQTWNRQNGLPANGVNAIAQTTDGYLWFGTAAGLLRFDGTEFKLLDLHSVAGVPQQPRDEFGRRQFRRFCGWDWKEQRVWLFRWPVVFPSAAGRIRKLAGLNVRSILEGKDGTVWLAAEKIKAARLNRSGKLEPVLTETVLKSSLSTNLAANFTCGYRKTGRAGSWFGTVNQGVYCWQDGKTFKLSDPELDASRSVLSMVGRCGWSNLGRHGCRVVLL